MWSSVGQWPRSYLCRFCCSIVIVLPIVWSVFFAFSFGPCQITHSLLTYLPELILSLIWVMFRLEIWTSLPTKLEKNSKTDFSNVKIYSLNRPETSNMVFLEIVAMRWGLEMGLNIIRMCEGSESSWCVIVLQNCRLINNRLANSPDHYCWALDLYLNCEKFLDNLSIVQEPFFPFTAVIDHP